MDDPTVEYLADELEEALQPFADAGWHVSICGDWIDADHVGLFAVVDAVPVLNLRVFASCDGSREFLIQELWKVLSEELGLRRAGGLHSVWE